MKNEGALGTAFSILRSVGTTSVKSLVVGVLMNVGFRAVSGLGWAITIAEMAYCVYKEIYKPTFLCAYPMVIPSWWTPEMGLEALSLPTIIYDYTGKLIYSQVPEDQIGKVKAIFRVASPNSLLFMHHGEDMISEDSILIEE